MVGIASKSKYKEIPKKYISYNSYEKAVKESGCDVVYISLHNSAHYEWIMYCLQNNKHIICDKPAVLNKKQALECYRKAGNNLILFESFAYIYHPQHDLIMKYLKEKCSLQKITAYFGFPFLEQGNFRNDLSLGGGCLYDIGPYMISVGQFYFRKPAIKIYCNSYTFEGCEVPTSASVTIYYGDNEILQGHFGFKLEYKNHLDLWGHKFNIHLDRVFTIPLDFFNTINYKSEDKMNVISIRPSDAFCEMFNHFSDVYNKKNLECNNLFLQQSIQLDAMIKSAKTKTVQTIQYGNMK